MLLTSMSFLDQLSVTMNLISIFHDFLMIFVMMILINIFSLLVFLTMNKSMNLFMNDFDLLEILWTLYPIIIILMILIPSLKVLYSNESLMVSFYQLTLKVYSSQWYWSTSLESETLNLNKKSLMKFSYISPLEKNLNIKNILQSLKTVNVDNKVTLPSSTSIRVLVTSTDVIHSWTIPSLGVKMDAIPGRINQLELFMKNMGIYYGQCSEICGMNHSIMPFVILSLPMNYFLESEFFLNLVN